ncbi:MAG: hypothetical protein JST11_26865 [Acidobacteria bacterium]|nr:hypothetical protein [Acidobacteriota bacterium]
MTGAEFLRRLTRLGKQRDVPVAFDPGHGDGSHGRVYYGRSFTTLKDRKKEIGRGLLRGMCKQLGVDPRDL